MKSIHRKAELSANIAIIAVSLLLGIVVVKQYILDGSKGRVAITKGIPVGTRISLPDVDWTKNRQTLLLVLSQGCHFCSESAPFYQRLVRKTADNADVRLIAIVPPEDSESRKYLDDLGLSVDEVRKVPLSLIGVTGTPTLILVNESGLVTGNWVGLLPPDKESEVLTKLHSDRASNSQ